MIEITMPHPESSSPGRSFWHHYSRMLSVMVLIALALVAAGYWPTLRMAGRGGLPAMLVGVGSSLLASAMGAILIGLALAGPTDKLSVAILGATCVRFLVILPLVALFALTRWVEPVPLAVWVAVSYLGLLFVDTVYSVSALRAARGARE